jgi:aminoglycoside 3-N-acetyltransferase
MNMDCKEQTIDMTGRCPRITKSQLVMQCKEIGLAIGDTVMVHASCRSVGEMLGGPDVLIDAILESVGSEGTMMVYVGCPSPYDDVGRRIFSPEQEAFIIEHCPPFDPDTCRASRDFGILAEFFRTRVGVRLSRNVGARMAALGAKADWLTREHSLAYGLGKDSPLERLCQIGGKVLLVGADFDNVTLLHYAEAISSVTDKKIVHIKVPLLVSGERQWVDVEEYNSSTGIRDCPDRFFAEIIQQFLETSDAACGKFGNAISYALPAKTLVDFAIPLMVKTARQLDGQRT